MDEWPLKVMIAVPTNCGQRYGRQASTPPIGVTTSFRVGGGFFEAVDRARALVDPSLTRNMFMHLAVLRVAEAINRHNDEYLKWVSGKLHDDARRDDDRSSSRDNNRGPF